MPQNKQFDRKNPKKRYEMEQGVNVEHVPYLNKSPQPRFEPRRTAGTRTETEFALGTKISPEPISPMEAEPQSTNLPINTRPNHRSYPWYRRRYVSVEALQEATLVEITTGGSGTYYIKRIGHSYEDTQVEFRLEYDDVVWMRWDFQLGGVGSTGGMYELHCALPARRKIRFIVRNLAAETRLYEAALDGWFNETAGVSRGTGGFS